MSFFLIPCLTMELYAAHAELPSEAAKGCSVIAEFLRPISGSSVEKRVDEFTEDEQHFVGCQVRYRGPIHGPASIARLLQHEGWQKIGNSADDGMEGGHIDFVKSDADCRIKVEWPDSPDNAASPPLSVLCSGRRIPVRAVAMQTDVRPTRTRCPSGTYPDVSEMGTLVCCDAEAHCE